MSPKTRRFALRHSSDKLLPDSVLKCVAQHDSVVVILIVSRICTANLPAASAAGPAIDGIGSNRRRAHYYEVS